MLRTKLRNRFSKKRILEPRTIAGNIRISIVKKAKQNYCEHLDLKDILMIIESSGLQQNLYFLTK